MKEKNEIEDKISREDAKTLSNAKVEDKSVLAPATLEGERATKKAELEKLQRKLLQKMRKGCVDYGLLEDGDHVLIGLSGGKDSLALVELLGLQQRIFVPRIQVTAVHISVTNIGYQTNLAYLQKFCEDRGVQFYHRTTQYDESTDPRRSHCFLCSWYRRKALFETANELNCNKIALGHHKDDIVETLLLNMVFQGNFGTIAPKLQMEKFPIQMIRPLCLIKEEELQRYAEMSGYERIPKLCPYEKESNRADMKGIVAQLKALNPNALDSIWGAMENIKDEYLPKKSP